MKKTCFIVAVLLLFFVSCGRSNKTNVNMESSDFSARFSVDPFWPKPLPNNWLIGQVPGIAIDSKDHVWILHRPGSLGENEAGPDWKSQKLPYTPAPPVLEFDADGNLINSWGGPNEGYEWPENEHGIYIDNEDNVWISASGRNEHQVLKFTSGGKFLFQIGKSGKTGGSNDTMFLGRPTDIDVDPVAKEVYITDGYLNKRVIVFDSNTGEYKRHWGAYGNKPDDKEQHPYNPDMPPSTQFGTATHAIRISNDNLVYVCDRSNNRIQVFQKNGTFIFEEFIAKNTLGAGSTWDLDFSRDSQQKMVYVADGTNQCIWILQRDGLKVMGHFGRIGRYAGQFIWLHNLAVDSKGNIYTGEVYTGKRAQKFIYKP